MLRLSNESKAAAIGTASFTAGRIATRDRFLRSKTSLVSDLIRIGRLQLAEGDWRDSVAMYNYARRLDETSESYLLSSKSESTRPRRAEGSLS